MQLANGFSKADGTTLDLVWRAIGDCNTSMSSYAQIHRQFVQIVDEPFVWTPKGTLSRKATYVKFSKEIDSLYQEQSLGSQVNPSDFDQLHASLLKSARQAIGNMSLAADDDLFQSGFDSSSIQLFHRSIEASGQLLQLKTIYDHPSVDRRVRRFGNLFSLKTSILRVQLMTFALSLPSTHPVSNQNQRVHASSLQAPRDSWAATCLIPSSQIRRFLKSGALTGTRMLSRSSSNLPKTKACEMTGDPRSDSLQRSWDFRTGDWERQIIGCF